MIEGPQINHKGTMVCDMIDDRHDPIFLSRPGTGGTRVPVHLTCLSSIPTLFPPLSLYVLRGLVYFLLD